MKARLAGGIALIGLLGGCNASEHSMPPETGNRASPTPKIVVTHDDGTLGPRCGIRHTVSSMVAFIEAFNHGDEAALGRAMASGEHFQWYTANAGHGRRARSFSASERTPALRYLVQRSKAGERMHLVQVMVSRVARRSWLPSITDEVAGVQFEISLHAPDFASLPGRNRLAGGKGAFGCSDGRLLMWTMGLDTARGRLIHRELLCRRASRALREIRRRVIACSD